MAILIILLGLAFMLVNPFFGMIVLAVGFLWRKTDEVEQELGSSPLIVGCCMLIAVLIVVVADSGQRGGRDGIRHHGGSGFVAFASWPEPAVYQINGQADAG